MSASREILLSTYRTGRMKKVRKFVYIAQVIIIIFIIFLITWLSTEASFDPLYLPVGTYFFILLMLILVVNVEDIFFKYFGIKWAKSDSERFLSAKDYSKIGIAIVIGAIIIMVLINVMAPIMDDSIDETKEIMVFGEYNYEFSSQDSFAITGVDTIEVTSDNQSISLDIYLLRKNDFEDQIYSRRLNLDDNVSKDITELKYKSDGFLKNGDYVIYLNSRGMDAPVTITLYRSISPTLVLYLTVFPIIFAVMNVIWAIYLWPLRKRYEKTSIYE